MNHCVPNLDVLSLEVDDAHPCPLPSEKGEVAALFFSDGGGVEYSSARKPTGAPTGACIYMPWMETENDEEKRTNVFEMSQESGLAIDVSPSHTPFQEDEMLSWLQYPLDDTFSKAYCSEQNYEQAFTSFSSQNLFPKASGERLSTPSLSTKLIENTDSNILGQSVTMDAALALGAERAAGLAPQAGAEVFDRVHTIRQACDDVSNSKATDAADNPSINHSALENAGKRNSMNFPFFSQHVAAIKSSVQIIGAANGPLIKDRLRQSSIIQSNEGTEGTASTGQSTSTVCLTNFDPLGESGLNEVKQGLNEVKQEIAQDNVGCDDDKARQELSKYSLAVGTEFLETVDVTLTSLSGDSDYSTGKSTKEVSGKMPAEETDCESKDTGGVPLRKIGPTVARTTSAKRARAAEVHNQSERRRRNKINEKMKALQELIPNANKTDKASMLDEAIEYVKMLQAQLQLMSTRTGMIVPSITMPPGMQYLSVQQRPNTGGLNMGLGPRVMDASTSGVGASPKFVFLGQPVPGQHVYHMAGYPVVHEVQSHLQLNAMQNVPAFQQFQPGHMQQSNAIYKATSDLGKRQQG